MKWAEKDENYVCYYGCLLWCGEPRKEQGPQMGVVSLDVVVVFAEQSGIGVVCPFERSQLASDFRPVTLGLGENMVATVDELFLPILDFQDVESYGSGR